MKVLRATRQSHRVNLGPLTSGSPANGHRRSTKAMSVRANSRLGKVPFNHLLPVDRHAHSSAKSPCDRLFEAVGDDLRHAKLHLIAALRVNLEASNRKTARRWS